jgi:hypothetical protein
MLWETETGRDPVGTDPSEAVGEHVKWPPSVPGTGTPGTYRSPTVTGNVRDEFLHPDRPVVPRYENLDCYAQFDLRGWRKRLENLRLQNAADTRHVDCDRLAAVGRRSSEVRRASEPIDHVVQRGGEAAR